MFTNFDGFTEAQLEVLKGALQLRIAAEVVGRNVQAAELESSDKGGFYRCTVRMIAEIADTQNRKGFSGDMARN